MTAAPGKWQDAWSTVGKGSALAAIVAPEAQSLAAERAAARAAWRRHLLGVAVAAALAWVVLTWPLARHPDRLWAMTGGPGDRDQPTFYTRPGTFPSWDALQNVVIQSAVVDNLRELREPFLDRREGAAGPRPLRTSSLDLPWTLELALLWPLVGLVAAYNASLLTSTVVTAVAAFGFLRRHVRWPLAAAGALAYTFSPNRMFQLTSHFNAVMWWAFPAALWALESMLERHRAGRPWLRPALAFAAVVLTVALSGELHLTLYLTCLVALGTCWALAAALVLRRPLPWAPAATVAVTTAAAAGYVLAVFAYVFKGTVAGDNGSYGQVLWYAPPSLLALARKSFGHYGEGMVYLGWPLLLLAGAGELLALLARTRRGLLPYALLAPVLVLLTYGPRADLGPLRLYRFLFDHVPLLRLQRVPQRLMVVTALALVLLAAVALDAAASLASRAAAARAAPARWAALALLALATVALLADYHVSDSRLQPGEADNPVVLALRQAGDRAGPILGLPVLPAPTTWNSASTYLAALSRRRSLNAYNQAPAPWLDRRLRLLEPLNRGVSDPHALAILEATGTRHVVVVNEPHYFAPNRWRATIESLIGSGHFRLIVEQGSLALLERVD